MKKPPSDLKLNELLTMSRIELIEHFAGNKKIQLLVCILCFCAGLLMLGLYFWSGAAQQDSDVTGLIFGLLFVFFSGVVWLIYAKT